MSGGNETKEICTNTKWAQSRRKTVALTLPLIALNDCTVMRMLAGETSPESLNCAHRRIDVEQLFSGQYLAVYPAAFLIHTMFFMVLLGSRTWY